MTAFAAVSTVKVAVPMMFVAADADALAELGALLDAAVLVEIVLMLEARTSGEAVVAEEEERTSAVCDKADRAVCASMST